MTYALLCAIKLTFTRYDKPRWGTTFIQSKLSSFENGLFLVCKASIHRTSKLKIKYTSHIVWEISAHLQKAFDCVSHYILIKKLEFYGITDKFGALIEPYLKGRYQRANLDTNNSISKI
jgi:hypothetical protein